jgi:hypothetical protein
LRATANRAGGRGRKDALHEKGESAARKFEIKNESRYRPVIAARNVRQSRPTLSAGILGKNAGGIQRRLRSMTLHRKHPIHKKKGNPNPNRFHTHSCSYTLK